MFYLVLSGLVHVTFYQCIHMIKALGTCKSSLKLLTGAICFS